MKTRQFVKVGVAMMLLLMASVNVMTGCRSLSAGSGGYPSIDFPNPAAQLYDDDTAALARQHVDTLTLDK